jgi:hypothetical protein
MTKLITRTLTSFMGLAWNIVHAGERTVERCEAIGITDLAKPYAGFREKMAWRKGWAMVRAGEGLELSVNWIAMRLGYSDGEVSGMVARRNEADQLRISARTPSIVEPII